MKITWTSSSSGSTKSPYTTSTIRYKTYQTDVLGKNTPITVLQSPQTKSLLIAKNNKPARVYLGMTRAKDLCIATYTIASTKEFKKELEKGSKEELLQKINQGNSNSKVKEIKEIGSLTVNGHTIPYCKAVFEGNSGKESDGIIANFECPEGGKNFLVMAMAENGKYDEKITEDFLKNLKCH